MFVFYTSIIISGLISRRITATAAEITPDIFSHNPAAIGNTIIKRGTKIDNLTHIAHNCVIGEDCAITALVGFAGSVTFGSRVYVGGQAGFQGHISIGENTVIMAKSGVTKDVPKNSVISGFPAQEHKKELEIQALIRRLPSLFKKVFRPGA